MKKLLLICLIFLLIVSPFSLECRAEERSRESLREVYLWSLHKGESGTYINEPSTGAPYSAGLLTQETIAGALAEVNFIRWLAELDPLVADDGLNDLAQHGVVVMAANQALSHSPEKPLDMDETFYEIGYAAAASCNLVMFNWSEEGILRQAVQHFARDDGEGNRFVLGHRRWLLYPGMKYTGFGLAEDEEGRTYAAMYVMDASNEEADYDMICWPSAGAFPAEYMGTETSWSISLNPEKYDLDRSAPLIVLTERTTGAEYVFDVMEETSDQAQYLVMGGGRYGDGPAYIFHPDLSEYDELMYGYQQNQVWTVRVEGVFLADGTLADPIEYTVEMASLTPIDPAAVEIQPRELVLKAGESAALSAQVIPQWADDLSVIWQSEDESIATVDEEGTVRGQKAGICTIVAESVNGRYDCVEITVEE